MVRAAGGADLATVAAEAESALEPERVALTAPADESPSAAGTANAADGVRLTLTNPQGLHARPAALLATAVGDLDAEVTIAHEGRSADAASSARADDARGRPGRRLVITAAGPDAGAAVRAVRALVAEGFGEA